VAKTVLAEAVVVVQAVRRLLVSEQLNILAVMVHKAKAILAAVAAVRLA
jgi:hypothetical protein